MKDLKQVLFENMYRTFQIVKNKELRAEDREFYMHEAYVLWGVIAEAGLAKEYNKYAAFKKHKDIRRPLIRNDSDHIRVAGHCGTWYVIDSRCINDEQFFLLEHEKYGDETASVVINQYGELVEEDVWNGFDECVLEAIDEYFGMKEDD